MLNFILNFILNNIFYIVPIVGIFLISAIYSAKARSLFIAAASFITVISLTFIINRYSANNETIRSALVAMITLLCNAFHLVVHAFILNVYLIQMLYSAGVCDIFYNLAFSVVLSVLHNVVHYSFIIKGYIKKAHLYISHYIMAAFSYVKNIIIDSIFGSFLQIMRN